MTSLLSHPKKLLLFALLSLTDLLLTLWLLQNSGGQVYESNPVAEWLLDRCGWLGLAAFKAAMVTLAMALVAAIVHFRPQTGARVLGFACGTVAGVVLYSACLCWAIPTTLPAEQEMRRVSARLEEDYLRIREFEALLDRLAERLIRKQCTLRDAGVQLAQTERWQHQGLRDVMAMEHPGCSVEEFLAGYAIVRVADTLALRKEKRRTIAGVTRRLEQEFKETFGGAAPRLPRDMPGSASVGVS